MVRISFSESRAGQRGRAHCEPPGRGPLQDRVQQARAGPPVSTARGDRARSRASPTPGSASTTSASGYVAGPGSPAFRRRRTPPLPPDPAPSGGGREYSWQRRTGRRERAIVERGESRTWLPIKTHHSSSDRPPLSTPRSSSSAPGSSGIYQLHLLREAGFDVRLVEAGTNVGGNVVLEPLPGRPLRLRELLLRVLLLARAARRVELVGALRRAGRDRGVPEVRRRQARPA